MPKPFYINPDDLTGLASYLRGQGWLGGNEQLMRVERAGEGNMNLVLRALTNERSFILKQARPWVEKYPHIAAPQERALMEGRYYEYIRHNALLFAHSPRLAGKNEEDFILCFEDLGFAADMMGLYGDELIAEEELGVLVCYLSELHSMEHGQDVRVHIANGAMRQLNHYHLFVFPFEKDNGFPFNGIQDGLAEIALQFKEDKKMKQRIAQLGEVYLADGDTLLHGDFYPGSWLKAKDGIKVIDPEFCFHGRSEFDVAVFLAHLKLAAQPQDAIQFVLENYAGNLDEKLLFGFTGVEVMRRLLGMAQLPLRFSLQEKQRLLEEARDMILSPHFNLISYAHG